MENIPFPETWYRDITRVDGRPLGMSITTINKVFLPDFIIMGRELVQQLLDTIFLSNRVNIGHLVIWQSGEIKVDLEEKKYTELVR